MSRNQILKIATGICALVLVCAVVISLRGVFGQIGGYANADQYTTGDTEISGGVKNLDVNWTSGKVTVAYHDKDTVEIREIADKPLAEDQKLRWWLDGDTLRVQYSAPGLKLNWNLNKELTLTLPEGIGLNQASFSLTSGDLVLPEIRAEELTITTTSGNVNAEAEAGKVESNSTSGDLTLVLKGKTQSVQAHSTSGTMHVEAEEAEKAGFGSTSGNIGLQIGRAGSTEVSSTSGTVNLSLKHLESLKVSSTSGNVTAALPEEPGFQAEITTASGSVDTGMALAKDGNRYTCGDGSGKVRITTTSGSVRIETAE